jgi:ABC-type transport system involved in multi-copper enzyme maturation permease subunit
LWIPLALAFALALLIILTSSEIFLSGEDWLRLGVFFALACLFLGQIFALSLMVSCFTGQSATSLVICLFGWLVGGVVYMNLMPSLIEYGVEEIPWQNFVDASGAARSEYRREVQEWEERHPSPGEVYLKGIEEGRRLRYAHPKGYTWLQQRSAFTFDKDLKLAERIKELDWENQEPLAREAQLVTSWSILSPFTNFRVLSYQLARTALDDKFYLARQGHRYRKTYIEYLRSKKAFASGRWFTDDPPDQESMIPDPEAVTPQMLVPDAPFMQERMTWVQEQEGRAAKDARRQLDLRDLPKFGADGRRSLAASLQIMYYRLETEFITEGGANWFDNTFYLNPGAGRNVIFAAHKGGFNNWMQRYEVVDWTLLVRYVLSFLCIVLAYNSVSGEMESGTLRLALANPLSRGRWLVGKFFAYLGLLLAATLLGSLFSLLVLSLNGALDLNGTVVRGYLFFFLATAFYLTLFLFLSMGISCLARSSATSLVLLILMWAILVIIIPQTSYLVAVQQVKSVGAWWQKPFEVIGEEEKRLEREGLGLRGRELGKVDDYAMEKQYARRIREAEKEQGQLMKRAYAQNLEQYKVAKAVNLFSPGFAFQYALEAFLGVGIKRYENFLQQTWHYRDTLRDFIRTRDATDADSPHILFQGYLSDEPLDHNHIPRVKAQPIALAEGVSAGVMPIAILVLEAFAAFFFALWAFNRAELAG